MAAFQFSSPSVSGCTGGTIPELCSPTRSLSPSPSCEPPSGWGWGAGAYAIALTVAVMRNYNNWHWLSDCLFGAGLGILTAHVGEWLLEPVKDLFRIPTISWDGLRKTQVQTAFVPRVDPVSGAMCASLAFVF